MCISQFGMSKLDLGLSESRLFMYTKRLHEYYIHIYICTYTNVLIRMHISVNIYSTYTCMQKFMYIYICINIYKYMYVYIHVYIDMYTYVYIQIHVSVPPDNGSL
jgi:hypothetical protein